MKIKLLIVVLVLLIAINIGTLGSYLYVQFFQEKKDRFAELRMRSHFPPEDRPDLRLKRKQREQLRNLLRDFSRETEPLQTQAMKLEREMFLLLQQTPIPMEEINPKLQEISDIRLKIMSAAINNMINAKSFLTPEQQRHFFKALLLSRPGFYEGRRSPGGRHPRSNFDQFLEFYNN